MAHYKTIPLWVLVQRRTSFPGGASSKEPACQRRRCKTQGFDPWVRKIPLEEEMTNHSSILARTSPMDRGAWWATVMIEATYHTHVVRIMYTQLYILAIKKILVFLQSYLSNIPFNDMMRKSFHKLKLQLLCIYTFLLMYIANFQVFMSLGTYFV